MTFYQVDIILFVLQTTIESIKMLDVSQLLMAQQIINYADQVNSQFSQTQSQYVSIGQRLRDATSNSTFNTALLDDAVEEFKFRNPHLVKWTTLLYLRPQ